MSDTPSSLIKHQLSQIKLLSSQLTAKDSSLLALQAENERLSSFIAGCQSSLGGLQRDYRNMEEDYKIRLSIASDEIKTLNSQKNSVKIFASDLQIQVNAQLNELNMLRAENSELRMIVERREKERELEVEEERKREEEVEILIRKLEKMEEELVKSERRREELEEEMREWEEEGRRIEDERRRTEEEGLILEEELERRGRRCEEFDQIRLELEKERFEKEEYRRMVEEGERIEEERRKDEEEREEEENIRRREETDKIFHLTDELKLFQLKLSELSETNKSLESTLTEERGKFSKFESDIQNLMLLLESGKPKFSSTLPLTSDSSNLKLLRNQIITFLKEKKQLKKQSSSLIETQKSLMNDFFVLNKKIQELSSKLKGEEVKKSEINDLGQKLGKLDNLARKEKEGFERNMAEKEKCLEDVSKLLDEHVVLLKKKEIEKNELINILQNKNEETCANMYMSPIKGRNNGINKEGFENNELNIFFDNSFAVVSILLEVISKMHMKIRNLVEIKHYLSNSMLYYATIHENLNGKRNSKTRKFKKIAWSIIFCEILFKMWNQSNLKAFKNRDNMLMIQQKYMKNDLFSLINSNFELDNNKKSIIGRCFANANDLYELATEVLNLLDLPNINFKTKNSNIIFYSLLKDMEILKGLKENNQKNHFNLATLSINEKNGNHSSNQKKDSIQNKSKTINKSKNPTYPPKISINSIVTSANPPQNSVNYPQNSINNAQNSVNNIQKESLYREINEEMEGKIRNIVEENNEMRKMVQGLNDRLQEISIENNNFKNMLENSENKRSILIQNLKELEKHSQELYSENLQLKGH